MLGYLQTTTEDHPGALDRRSVDPKGRLTPRWFKRPHQGCHHLSTPLQIPPTHLYYKYKCRRHLEDISSQDHLKEARRS